MTETTSMKSINRSWRWFIRFAPYGIFCGIFIVSPPFLPLYAQSLMTKTLIFAIFALSLDLLMGYAGLVSLGHAAFFGTGGYLVGIQMIHYGINNFWINASFGILIVAAIAAIFGLIALRVTGFYFLFVTFALGQLLFSIAWTWKWLSSMGIEGFVGIQYPSLGLSGFSFNSISFYYFILLIFGFCYFLLMRIVNSPFGYALRGISESELRMRALGYNTWLFRYFAFVIAGVFAGIAGILFGYHNGIVVPADFGVTTSALVLLIVILGGVGTLYGPFIGAVVMIPLQFYSGIITPERWPLILGLAYILSVVYARAGIGVFLFKLWRRVIR